MMGIHMERWAKIVDKKVRRWVLLPGRWWGGGGILVPSRGSFLCQLSPPELQAQPLEP